MRSVIRFDIHQRIQHWFMLSGVILLGITGWPLRGAGTFGNSPIIGGQDAAPYSQAFMKIFGGAEGAALWHRVGAVLIIISAIYHLFYLTFLASQKRLPLSMLPAEGRARHARQHPLHARREEGAAQVRPVHVPGEVRLLGRVLGHRDDGRHRLHLLVPGLLRGLGAEWLITAALIVHGEEATLAILFLFVVHFYNVHLKPSIFPMNWAWLNGRISVEMMKHEHPLEYERMGDDKK